MKLPIVTVHLAVFLSMACVSNAWAAEGPAPEPPRLTREQLREQIRNLPPEERAARIKEWRAKPVPPRDEWDRQREILKNLPPAEREAKIKELRNRGGLERKLEELKKLTAEERTARQREIRQRLEHQLSLLQKKQADGTLSDEEGVRLRRLEQIHHRLTNAPTPVVQAETTQPEKPLQRSPAQSDGHP